jgi:hypothetical protein
MFILANAWAARRAEFQLPTLGFGRNVRATLQLPAAKRAVNHGLIEESGALVGLHVPDCDVEHTAILDAKKTIRWLLKRVLKVPAA